MSRGKRRQFSEEFKREAVTLLQQRRKDGRSAAFVGHELGVGPELLRRWERELFGEQPTTEVDPLQLEIKRLRKALAIAEQERDFLKKAAAYFSKESLRGTP